MRAAAAGQCRCCSPPQCPRRGIIARSAAEPEVGGSRSPCLRHTQAQVGQALLVAAIYRGEVAGEREMGDMTTRMQHDHEQVRSRIVADYD